MGAAVEFLIVGQGLAGTALAWELIWRGRDVLVVDAGEAVTSSKIAAGLVTPITGQRLALGWRVDEMLAAVRPIIRESRALIGLHPVREKLGFFNGLGSKGSLHAPFFARQLAAHLVDGAPLEPEADVRRNC